MSYAPNTQCRGEYSLASAGRLDSVVNKFYVNIGSVNVNNGSINHGIQHSIAAQRTGDVHIYNHNQTIDNRIGAVNYVVNMDNRKIEFVSPYISPGQRQKYPGRKDTYLLPAPKTADYETANASYHNTITTGLLKRRRPVTQFIDSSEEIKGLVVDTFEKLTDADFPDNIVVNVLSDAQMRKAHTANGGRWNDGIMGFAVNRWPETSAIFVRQNHLDALMLVVGHELGHVLSPQLSDAVSEEAKAFAFELAWAKTIMENDIGGLAGNFNTDFKPAANGLHDRAFAFVQDTVSKGKDALRTFWELAKGSLQFNSNKGMNTLQKAFI
jgi:hypothetical protein